MKYYKDTNTNEIYAYEDDVGDEIIGNKVLISDEDLAGELDRIKAEHLSRLDYAAQRRLEYPSLGDQLDALWKGGDALEAMRQQVLAVKSKYPKPQ